METTPVRVLLYSHDSQGLGHVRRNLTIAHHIVAAIPAATGRPVSGLLVSGLAPASVFPLPQGFDWLTIPGISKGKDGYQPRNLGEPTHNLIRLRSELLKSTLLSFAPDLVIIDRHIYGVWKELFTPLEQLRTAHPHASVVLGLREVLDEPAVAAAEWESLGNPEQLCDIVDEVWVYGDPAVHNPLKTGEIPDFFTDRLRFTGYLADGRALSLGEVVFDDEVGTAIKGDEQVAALFGGRDVLRAEAGGKVGELVAGTVNRLDMLRFPCSIKLILANHVIGCIVYLKGDLSGHRCFPEFHYIYAAKSSNFLAIMKG